MKITNTILVLSAVALSAACSSDNSATAISDDAQSVVNIQLNTMSFVLEKNDTVGGNLTTSTRSIAGGTGNSFQTQFVYDDSVGIFPQGSYQIPFRIPLNKGDKPSGSVSIIAEGWSTKEGILYAAYHPFVFEYRSGSHIPFDLRVIQKQKANDFRDSLGNYWVIGSDVGYPTLRDDGVTVLQTTLVAMEALIRMRCTVPVTAKYVRAMFVAPSPVFATHGYYDLFDTSGQKVDWANASRTQVPIPMTYQPKHVEAGDYTDHVTLDLEDIQVNAGSYLYCYMVVPEANIERQTVTVYLWDSDGNIYKCEQALTGTRGYFSRASISYLPFTSFTQVPSIDVQLNDWEKEELCPTCTPVAW